MEKKLIDLLNQILNDKNYRLYNIKQFYTLVFNDDHVDIDNAKWEILNDLALDFQYYEPEPHVCKEDASYYGKEELERRIKKTLNKIEKLK